MRRVFVDPAAPQRDAIEEAAKWIASGYLVAIPTDTLYGLAVDPFRAEAVERLFMVKGRSSDQPIPLIAADAAQIAATLAPLTGIAAKMAERCWPGPLTLVIRAPRTIAAAVTAGTGTVGVRVPNHDVARAIARTCGRPVTATSANISGQPATGDPNLVEETLGDRVDMLVDTGPTVGGAPSTIVDVTGAAPRLVRAGAIAWEDIQRWLS
jgi:L-threonylcarbamoyladenylate synthase